MPDEAIPVSTSVPAPVAPAAQTASPQSDTSAQPSTPTARDAVPPSTTTPAAETPVTTPAVDDAPAAETSVLGTVADPAPTDGVDEDTAPAADAKASADGTEPKKEEGSQSEEPAPLPSYEAFTFPEGFQLDEKSLGEFTKDLGELQMTTKADQAVVQAFGQKLVDKYVAELTHAGERINEFYNNTWQKTKNDWKQEFYNEPEIGGNRQDTTIKAIAQGISQYGGTPEQQTAFRQLMDNTGVGNNVALIRTFHNMIGEINRLKTKYESETGTKPLPGTKPEPQAKSKVERRYGKSL